MGAYGKNEENDKASPGGRPQGGGVECHIALLSAKAVQQVD